MDELVRSGNTPQKVIFRIGIVLGAAEGISNAQLVRDLGTTKSSVLKWRGRYRENGLEVIEYFDARMIGLTATPANFIDRDTFRLFGCDANVPTFLYDYAQAVEEHFLVDFSLYQAHTSFQRKGIKGVDLSEEDRNALTEQGIDPDSLDYAGTEIEVEVSNRDTLRKQWEEVMERCLKDQSGQLPGKPVEHKSHPKDLLKQAPLLAPVDPADDGPQASLGESFGRRQGKELFLNVRSQIEQLHDLRHTGVRHPAEPCQFRESDPAAALPAMAGRDCAATSRGKENIPRLR